MIKKWCIDKNVKKAEMMAIVRTRGSENRKKALGVFIRGRRVDNSKIRRFEQRTASMPKDSVEGVYISH